MRIRLLSKLFPLAAMLTVFSQPVAAQTVKVGTEASYPPFSQTEADGRFTGFEIDLGNETCKRAGLACQWMKQDFDGMIAAVNAGKLDMVVSSMSIKPERQKVVDFSLPYYVEKNRFYTEKGNEKPLDGGLEGKSVGVYSGSTQETFIKTSFPKMVVRGYANIDQIHADLVAGRIDYAFNTSVSAKAFLDSPEGQGYAFVGPDYSRQDIFGPGVGVMFRKGDPLRLRVDEALKAIYADGTFDALQKKYFPGVDLRADANWK